MSMKKDDLKELLLRSVTDEISDSDRDILETSAIPEYSFSSSFRDKVLNMVAGINKTSLLRPDIFAGWNTAFLRIALSGAAAILLLALSLFISQGSLSYDTLLGLDTSVDQVMVSVLIK